jgi:glutamate/tyrosine decarboxylase-like PLP-dependent enzyme
MMTGDQLTSLLSRANEIALDFLRDVADRKVCARDVVPASLPTCLPDHPTDALSTLNALATAMDGGLVATAGPRYFGFVIGGSLPVTVAADWLVSAWDQNAALNVMSPAAAAIEDVAAAWLLDVLRLPATASVGFVTGATMANVTALAAARHDVLRRVGWDVEADGLQGAPRITVIVGEEGHASIYSACRLLGFGSSTLVRVQADDQGRMLPGALQRAASGTRGPLIVCAQAGHVNTGAFDPFEPIVAIARDRGAWLHVDGAFGLWARVADRLRPLTTGLEGADSWATDAHKWLNVPYDCGLAIVAHPEPHRAAMAQTASYLLRASGERRDGMDWTPESSRRARAIPIYAALHALGRSGLADLVTGCCDRAQQMASRLRGASGVTVLNDVVLNQVLVQMRSRTGVNVTDEVIGRTQAEGECWVGGTDWNGERAMRISISNWSTREADIDRAADSILRATHETTQTVHHEDRRDH